jgi:hypothetical protein
MNDTAIGLTTNPSDYAKAVADMIEQGRVDPFLRVLFDVIVDRKKALEATPAGLPQQDTVDELPSADVVCQVFEAGRMPPMTASWSDPVSAFDNPPPPASVIPTDPKQYRRKSPRKTAAAAPDAPARHGTRNLTYSQPDPTEPVFTGIIPPMDAARLQQSDPRDQIAIGGKVYDKREIKGKYVNYEIEGLTVRFKITGIGPKAVQGLLVYSPAQLGNPHLSLRGRLLQPSFDDVKPVYLPHAAIAHWLG